MALSAARTTRGAVLVALVLVGACGERGARAPGKQYALQPLSLPGAHGVVTLDYFAYDRLRARLWVPAGNTASVDVIDGKTDQITRIQGFHTAGVPLRGKRPVLGPSSVTIGDGVAYVGNRADSRICIIDASALRLGDCVALAPDAAGLAASPDGVVYVAPTKELRWAGAS